jgi:hypothetical protein
MFGRIVIECETDSPYTAQEVVSVLEKMLPYMAHNVIVTSSWEWSCSQSK